MNTPSSRPVVPALLGLLALLAGLGFWAFQSRQSGGAGDGAPGPGAGAATAQPVPVIIYLIDTLRADRIGAYGYGRPTTPRMDALARESVLFEHAYSAAPWTLPSVASLFTSTFSCEHGLTKKGLRLDPALPTLAERLAGIGYDTVSWYHNGFAGPVAGLDRGMRISEFRREAPSLAPDVAGYLAQGGGGGRPFYMYLHTIEPHQAFNVPPKYMQPFGFVNVEQREAFRASWELYSAAKHADIQAGKAEGASGSQPYLRQAAANLAGMKDAIAISYDAAVLEADTQLGEVIDALKAAGTWDRAVFIVLADHGEEFGEHGGWFHDQSVYEELVHVPLIVHLPGGAGGGRRVAQRVGLVDVAPTVLDLVGRPELCTGCRGRSFAGLLRGEEGGYVSAEVPALRINETTFDEAAAKRIGNRNVVVRMGELKGILDLDPGRVELYDLAADPGETKDLGAERPDVARDVARRAEAWFDGCRKTEQAPEPVRPGQVDPATENQLRALGYLR